jgi:hypothetical protein
MKLTDWTAAAEVLDGFRTGFPDHELNREATKQLAFVYREGGETSLAAAEYERVATEAAEPELAREALLSAGELYELGRDADSARAVYERYLAQFPQPLDIAVETRAKVAEMYRARGDLPRHHEHLAALVAADANGGSERTDRTRYLAAQAGLVLAEPGYAAFNAVQLVEPLEQNLTRKRALMDASLQEFERLIAYEVGDVTTAATFYMRRSTRISAARCSTRRGRRICPPPSSPRTRRRSRRRPFRSRSARSRSTRRTSPS